MAELSPVKQLYAAKVNDLYATYKPKHHNTNMAKKLVRTWPDGQEESVYQNMLKKYAIRQPSPNRSSSMSQSSLAVQETADGTLALSPSSVGTLEPTPTSAMDLAHAGIGSEPAPLTPVQMAYIEKVNALYAIHKPEKLQKEKSKNGAAEETVRAWRPGTEEQNYRNLEKKFTTKQATATSAVAMNAAASNTQTTAASNPSTASTTSVVTPHPAQPVIIQHNNHHNQNNHHNHQHIDTTRNGTVQYPLSHTHGHPPAAAQPSHHPSAFNTTTITTTTSPSSSAPLDPIHVDPPMPPYPRIDVPSSPPPPTPTPLLVATPTPIPTATTTVGHHMAVVTHRPVMVNKRNVSRGVSVGQAQHHITPVRSHRSVGIASMSGRVSVGPRSVSATPSTISVHDETSKVNYHQRKGNFYSIFADRSLKRDLPAVLESRSGNGRV